MSFFELFAVAIWILAVSVGTVAIILGIVENIRDMWRHRD